MAASPYANWFTSFRNVSGIFSDYGSGRARNFFLYIKPDFRIPFKTSYLVSQKCFPLYKIRSVAKCNLGKVKSQANAVSGLLLERAWFVGWPQGPFAYLVIFADLLLERIFADSGSQPVLPLLCIGKYGVIWVFSTKFFQAWRCRLAAACRGGCCSQGCHGFLLAMPEAFRLPSNL